MMFDASYALGASSIFNNNSDMFLEKTGRLVLSSVFKYVCNSIFKNVSCALFHSEGSIQHKLTQILRYRKHSAYHLLTLFSNNKTWEMFLL